MHLSKVVTIAACSFSALIASDVMADWREFNHDAHGTRNAGQDDSCLTPQNVGKLKVKWKFATPAQVSGTPAVAGGRVYVGDFAGNVYSLDEHTGALVWKTAAQSLVTASALVTDDRVVIGDIAGYLYGLDRDTGSIVWQFRPSPHPLAAIWGSGVKVGRYVAYGVASNEEDAAANPQYPCCSFRGSVLMFDPEDGRVVWQTTTISDAAATQGASGAAVWSSPTYDEDLGLLFVTTGNNYTGNTGTSDAFIALDAETGNVAWINQRTPNDSWNGRTPFGLGHDDFDFGDSPQVYRLSDGHKVVGAGQKSGLYHVLDAATGAVVNFQQYQVGTSLGGLLADSGVGYGMVFAPSSNWPISSTATIGAPTTGDLIAISGDGSHEIWRFAVPQTADVGPVAIANGVVYFSQAFSGNFYALDAFTGRPLATLAIGAGGSGPSVAEGMVFVGTGNVFSPALIPSTVTALGL
jgi:polyvinyl alcohol dehydrogenase (cytochrome)